MIITRISSRNCRTDFFHCHEQVGKITPFIIYRPNVTQCTAIDIGSNDAQPTSFVRAVWQKEFLATKPRDISTTCAITSSLAVYRKFCPLLDGVNIEPPR